MDNTGPLSISTHKSSQRKFFQWAVKWFYTDQTDDITVKPDASELACLLQAMGFQLREFEKHADNNGLIKAKTGSLKVTIECGSSEMRAIMELDDVTCQCPNPDDAKDASFWSVSGTGPLGSMENMNKVVETGSNLLPSMSKGDATVVRDVAQHLLKVIRNVPDVNQNTSSTMNLDSIEDSLKIPPNADAGVTPFTRRHTQPDFNTGRCRSLDTLIQTDEKENEKTHSSPLPPQDLPMPRNRSSSDSKHKPQKSSWNKASLKEELETADSTSFSVRLQRQKTFDMDTETLPVERKSSPSPSRMSLGSPAPLPQLCTSLGQISLHSERQDSSLVEILVKAKNNLEIALTMLLNNPQAQNLISEELFLKPAPPKNSSSFRISPGNNSRPESSCSLPVNPSSRKSGLQKLSVRRSVAASFTQVSDGVKSPGNKLSAPTNRSLLQRRSIGGRLSTPKSLGLKVDTPRPGTSGSSLNSSTSRITLAAKRRVSPDPKSSPSQIHKANISLNMSSSQKTSVGSHNKSNIATPKIAPGGIGANKFGFTKKKV